MQTTVAALKDFSFPFPAFGLPNYLVRVLASLLLTFSVAIMSSEPKYVIADR